MKLIIGLVTFLISFIIMLINHFTFKSVIVPTVFLTIGCILIVLNWINNVIIPRSKLIRKKINPDFYYLKKQLNIKANDRNFGETGLYAKAMVFNTYIVPIILISIVFLI